MSNGRPVSERHFSNGRPVTERHLVTADLSLRDTLVTAGLVLSAPEGAGTSPTVDLQPSLRCSGIMLKISFGLPKLLLRRCGRLAAVGCDAAGCFTPWCSSTMRARALA